MDRMLRLPRRLCGNLLFVTVLCCGSFCLEAGQDDLQTWQGRALAEFPELGVAGSAFNALFLEEARLLRHKKSALLQDPSWPYRLARQVAASPELARQAGSRETGRNPSPESASAGGGVLASKNVQVRGGSSAAADRSVGLANLCLDAVEAQFAGGAVNEDRAAWIQEGKIVPRARLRALRLAVAMNEAVYFDVLGLFLEEVIKAPVDLGNEELHWLKAVLAANETHAACAGVLGVSETQMVESLLVRADSPGFTLEWLGGGTGGFVPPMKIPASHRLEMLQRVFASQFKLGAMHLSEEACLEICFRINPEVAGGGFLLLEKVPVKSFPENCLVNLNAPVSKFSPAKKEWVAYMRALVQMHEELKSGKISPFSAYFPACAGTGGFEQFVLWESLRKDSFGESIRWVDSLAPELYKHTGLQAREARRVLPALNHVLSQLALAENVEAKAAASIAGKRDALPALSNPAIRPVSKGPTAAVSAAAISPAQNVKSVSPAPVSAAKSLKTGAAAK
jgi:hypothetical protein